MSRSFRQHIYRAEGETRLGDGAALAEDGRIVFPQIGAESVGGVPRVLRFGGSVEFEAHEGLLAVRLRAPWVEFDESEAVTLTFMHPAFREATERRLQLCRLDTVVPSAEDGEVVIEDAAAALLIQATGTFDNLYRPDAEFDPVSLRARVG